MPSHGCQKISTSHYAYARTLSVFPKRKDAHTERKRRKTSLAEHLHYLSSLGERFCFDYIASVLSKQPNTVASRVTTKNTLTAAVKLNKLTKLCKQHTLCTFISKHALTRLNNTPGRTRSLCSFASYPKQFYTSWFNFKATQVQRMHGSTSTGNWKTRISSLVQLTRLCNIPHFKVMKEDAERVM